MDKHIKTLTELLEWWYWDNEDPVKLDNLTYTSAEIKQLQIWIYDYLKYD